MDRALWGFAIVIDTLCLAASWPFFTSEPNAASIIWGIILLLIFTALLLLLLKPQIFGQHARLGAKVFCSAVPVAALFGSLDSASISGQEAFAIVVAVFVGWLNWTAFTRRATNVHARAA